MCTFVYQKYFELFVDQRVHNAYYTHDYYD